MLSSKDHLFIADMMPFNVGDMLIVGDMLFRQVLNVLDNIEESEETQG